jgi:HK97 family phage prohead protease
MKQVRFIPINTCGLKVREGEGQEQSRTVVGTPIVFGQRSNNLTPWSSYREVYEVMEPGCISDELLRESDIVLNLNHSNKVTDILGRCRNGEGTLKLTKSLRDIGCECDVAETNAGNDTLVLIKRGDITGMSFAFEDDYEDSENGVSYERMKNEDHDGKEVWVRHVKRVTALYDVSIVTHPAYEQTSVGTREASEAIDKAIEEQLKREQHQETEEEKQAREAKEREANGGETNAEKAAREAREQQEREANGGETNAEKAAREAREQQEREAEEEQRERERMAVQRRHQRNRVRRINDEILESLNY